MEVPGAGAAGVVGGDVLGGVTGLAGALDDGGAAVVGGVLEGGLYPLAGGGVPGGAGTGEYEAGGGPAGAAAVDGGTTPETPETPETPDDAPATCRAD